MKPALLCSVLLWLLALPARSEAQEFSVRRVEDDAVVHTGTLSGEIADRDTPFKARLADFSELEEPGEYYVEVPDVGRSVSFRIAENVYDGELANLMLGFYGWRSGVDVSFERHGILFEHAAGHLNDALLDYVDDQSGVQKDGIGGWYDAGDYGKYLPTASETVATMLAAWELFAENLQHLQLPFIPEHGSELPDYLSELNWELDWLLKMTYDDGSGRVHHKLNSVRFPGFVLPANDSSDRFFSTYSTAATAELVATLAKAARAFAPYDHVTDGYSETLLEAALLSYAYLRDHPENVAYDATVLAAGLYQKTDTEDRLWAAAELWETTGDEEVLADLEGRIAATTFFVPNFDWDHTANFGLLTYVLSEREGRDEALLTRLRMSLDTTAKLLVSYHEQSVYGRDFNLFYWGSNSVVARTCMLLQSANVLQPNPSYLDVCAAQIGYLYGRNQYNRSQVTGSGVEPPENPHHRPSGADAVDAPYPGLLVGGGETSTDWRDVQGSYSTNEVAINYNAALVYALAGFYAGSGETSLGRGPVEPADCGVRLNSVGYQPGRSKVATVQTECELPTTFQCAVGGETMSGDVTGPLRIIDDMDDTDDRIHTKDGRRGGWFSFDDGTSGARTEVEFVASDRPNGGSAACISGQGYTRWGGGLGVRLNEDGGTASAYDAAAYTGVSFWARGSSTRFRVMLVDGYSDPLGAVCSGCNDHFHVTITPSSEWQKYTFTWDDFEQLGFGDPQPNVCPAALYSLNFQWLANDSFELCLDDLAFTTPAGTPEETSVEAPRASGGGCGCRMATAQRSLGSAAVLLGLLAAIWRRRRGARRRGGRDGAC